MICLQNRVELKKIINCKRDDLLYIVRVAHKATLTMLDYEYLILSDQ